jgi:DNA-binding CsgD family transcriptional regulator
MTSRYLRVDRTKLTSREIDVLELASWGLTNAEAGRELGMHEETVKRHLRNVRWVLKARNTAHAVNEGWRQGYLGGRSRASKVS